MLSIVLAATSSHVNSETPNLTSISSSPVSVDAQSYTDPILIMGTPTNNDTGPGTLGITKLDPVTFSVSFTEWDCLDGIHASEDVPTYIIEAVRHILADGSVWEASVRYCISFKNKNK